MRILDIFPLVLPTLLLAACAAPLTERGHRLVERYYLPTTPMERARLRLSMTTPDGPLLQVHCERLAGANTADD
jgi:hypothetical protein